MIHFVEGTEHRLVLTASPLPPLYLASLAVDSELYSKLITSQAKGSSKFWNAHKTGVNLYGDDPANPLRDWNHVFVPYCSVGVDV